MYEKILATICTAVVTLGVLWFICKRDSDRRTGRGAGCNSDPVERDLDAAATNNKRLKDAEQRTKESIKRARETVERTDELIGRAGEDNKQGTELVQKAKHILHNAKHTDVNS